MTDKTRTAALRAALLLLLGLAAAYRVRSILVVAGLLVAPERVAQSGVSVGFGGNRIADVEPAAQRAGVAEGDLLHSVDGRPYTGRAVLMRATSGHSPGETLLLELTRPGERERRRAAVELQPLRAPARSYLLLLGIFNPLVCLVLGFGVAWLRPRDPRAWALLLLLLGFSQISEVRLPPYGAFALFWNVLLSELWSVGMLLFALLFPERLALDRRLPWLKWLLIVPIAAHGAAHALAATLDFEQYALVASVPAQLARHGTLLTILQMAAIGAFFASVGFRMGTAASPDARRRLRLLIVGSGIGLTPIWFVVLYAMFSGQDFGEGVPLPLLIATFLLLALFPVTLAYVIVVERAMDVRAVVRQGLQYALARRGIAVLQVVASLAVMLLVWNLVRDPTVNRPQSLTYLAWGVMFIALANQLASRVGAWIDRRFFREAVDAERVLSELSEEVRTIVEQDKLLDTVARRIADALHVPRVALLLQKDGALAVAHAHGFGADAPHARFAADGPTATRLREAKDALRVHLDDPQSWANREPGMQAERPALLALQSELLLPIALKDALLGVLSLGHKQSEEPYSPADVRLLRGVTSQTAFALENSRLTAAVASEVARTARMSREIEIAKEVQEQLFPQNYPKIPGLDIAGYCRPAAGVGGDYYDFLALKSGGLGVAIGDISGKGIPAALLMAGLQASLRGQALMGLTDLAALMDNVNVLLLDSSPANRYATFFYGQYDPKQRRLHYVNAGHNAPMLFRGEQVLRLTEGGPVVGLLSPAPFTEAQLALQPGDLLLGFTDGISECMDTGDQEWGEERLMQAIRDCRGLEAKAMIERLMAAADAFAAGAKQHDDMTLVVMKLLA